MFTFNKKLLAIFLLSSFLMSCSSTDDDEDVDVNEMAELIDIQEKFEAEVVWSNSVGSGVGDHFSRIKPVVAYDKVISASREGDVVALNQLTGKKMWSVDISDITNERGFFTSRKSAQLAGGPIAGMDKVFVGTENGEVFALDAETGTLAWQSKVKGEVIAPPAIDSGILVVNTASGIMKAFNATDGEELWTVEQDVPPLTLRGISQPIIASGGVIVGSASGTVSVFMLTEGQEGWTAEVGEASGSTEFERVIDVDSSPIVFGDKVYSISSRGNLVSIELKSGRVLWKRQYSSYRQIAISGNSIFLTDVKGHVFSIDRINGLERWSNLTLTNRSVTGPVVTGNYIVVGDTEGYLHWLDQDTGEFVARHHIDGSGIHATPTIDKDILYSQARNGDIEAIKTPL